MKYLACSVNVNYDYLSVITKGGKNETSGM